MKDKGTDQFSHYFISQIINVLMLILVWIILLYCTLPQNAQDVMATTFWFIFIFIFLSILMYPCFWKPKINCSICLLILGIICFLSGMIFIGIFFGIFYKQVAREFQEAYKCKIEEIQLANLDGSEKYGALGIRFTDSNGQELLGMGCISSKKYSGMGSAPYTYSDYEYGDSIYCGSNGGSGIESLSNDELKSPYYKGADNNNESRILYTGGSYGGGSYSGGSYSSSSYSSSSYSSYSYYDNYGPGSSACTYSQNWIQVKLPAWSCKDYDDFLQDVEQLDDQLVYDKCYYTPYFEESKAKQTAQSDDSVIDMDDFYLVTFEEKPYYNKMEFLLFAGFFLVPFITYTHISWIPFLANPLNKYYKNCKRNRVLNNMNAVAIQKNNLQQLKQEQQNKKEKEVQPNYQNNDNQATSIIPEFKNNDNDIAKKDKTDINIQKPQQYIIQNDQIKMAPPNPMQDSVKDIPPNPIFDPPYNYNINNQNILDQYQNNNINNNYNFNNYEQNNNNNDYYLQDYGQNNNQMHKINKDGDNQSDSSIQQPKMPYL